MKKLQKLQLQKKENQFVLMTPNDLNQLRGGDDPTYNGGTMCTITVTPEGNSCDGKDKESDVY